MNQILSPLGTVTTVLPFDFLTFDERLRQSVESFLNPFTGKELERLVEEVIPDPGCNVYRLISGQLIGFRVAGDLIQVSALGFGAPAGLMGD